MVEISNILSFNEGQKFDFEKEMIHLDIMAIIQNQMKEMKKKDLAEKLNVSRSYVSKLFAGEKLVNVDFLAKCQRIFDFKFKFAAVSNDYIRAKNLPTSKEITLIIHSNDRVTPDMDVSENLEKYA